ncbi:MAG: FtsW/RodA/SpoVE family cell cycle protein, partial [Myxococcota bacterium]
MLGPSMGQSPRLRDQVDWALLFVVIIISALGVINLYSATSVYFNIPNRSGLADIYVNQIYWLAIGGAMGTVVAAIDYRYIERFAYPIYGVGIFSLVLVSILARDVRGAARWLDLGPFRFQPSEFTKVCLVLALAKFLHDDAKNEERTLKDFVVPAALTALPALLIARQPDLGTALVHVLIFVSIAGVTRLRPKSMLAAITGGISGAYLVLEFALPYQRSRVTAFLNPEKDLTGAAYQAYHAKIAIGNGGLFGTGFLDGTQNQYGFLPDQYSDFPYPVFAEEWGFAGSLTLLCLYGFLILWSIRIASLARDRFGAVVAVGCGAM